MTRQFCHEKRGKNGHIFGKIRHCGRIEYMTILWLLPLKLGFSNHLLSQKNKVVIQHKKVCNE